MTIDLLCICPRPNTPKSPPLRALLQSLSLEASSANLASFDSSLRRNSEKKTLLQPNHFLILAPPPWRISSASSLDRVILSCFQEDGRRDCACFTNRWDACTFVNIGEPKSTTVKAPLGVSYLPRRGSHGFFPHTGIGVDVVEVFLTRRARCSLLPTRW